MIPIANGNSCALGKGAPHRMLAVFAALIILAIAQIACAEQNDVFSASPNGEVRAIAQQADRKLIIGGEFTAVSGVARLHMARLTQDGTVDAQFDPAPDDTVNCITTEPDGKILIGGMFHSIDSIDRSGIARLNTDGSLDSVLTANTNGPVNAIVVQPDGKILVAGEFGFIGGQKRQNIARLNADGSVDASFDPGANFWVFSIVLQGNGDIVVGGQFTAIATTARAYIARLHSDGGVDTTFNSNASYIVNTISARPDGRFLIGGVFRTIDGFPREYFAQLHTDGSLDTQFDQGADGSIVTSALQADGTAYLAGAFTNIGITHPMAFRNVARFLTDGSVDTAFDVGIDSTDSRAYGLLVQDDGSLIVGGAFSSVNAAPQSNILRSAAFESSVQTVSLIGNTLTWQRAGALPEFSTPPLISISADGVNFTPRGSMEAIAGGWRRENVVSPNASKSFFVRLSGQYSSGIYNGSHSSIEQTLQVDDDRLFMSGFEN